jgi:DNA-binding SARP family transcriptional activator/tetratricopeptide (TPR) repeat protein
MEFRILGDLEMERDGGCVPLGGYRERRVLAALLLDAGRVVPVPRLADVIWGEEPPVTASKQVMNAVSALRRVLGTDARDLIVTSAGGYRLAADRCSIDARVFEAGVAAAGRAVSEGKTAEAVGLLRSALALWRGPVLAGLAGGSLEPAASAWEERRVAALEMCLGLELEAGRHREVLGELAGLAAANPLREKLAGLYMVALHRCGRQADALAVYRGTRELLADQLGLDPRAELQQLQQQILTADPALAHPLRAVAQVRYTLPADTAVFTGRGVELGRIMTAVKDAAGRGGVVAVGAIDGMPGVGKTALAVHVAHGLAEQFPDQQLFIDLHAHTPGHDPVHPEDALAGLLTAVGVDPRYLPGDLEGRAAMWRDRLAGQRALLILDNAASSTQVASLLPGTTGCLVLVTSRRHLGDLPGAVTPILMDVLPQEEAADMFTRLAPRAGGDREGVAEVVGLAGFLPLAVSLLARVFARHPSWTLGDLAGETRVRLLTLTAENSSVAAAFEVSYRYLDPERQRFFCLLGVHPGATIDVYAAAALARTGRDEAAEHLEALHGEGLVTETGYRRYGMHDLIRRYARDLATSGQVGGASEQALDRLLDYYQHTAALASELVARQARPGPKLEVPAGIEVPVLEDAGRALAWVRAERASLLACLDLAAHDRQHARVVSLTAGLAAVLTRDGPWADAVTRYSDAAAAAQRLGDRLGEARARTDLGTVQRLTGDFSSAAQALELALGIYRGLGDRLGEANALTGLGVARYLTGEYPGAVQVAEVALGIYRDLGDRLGEANALRDLGVVRYQTGDFPGAAQVGELALGIYRGLGDRLGEANALRDLGVVRCVTGDYPGAAQVGELALGIYRDLGDRPGEANALHDLGSVRYLTGEYRAAAQVLEPALGIYREIGSRVGEANALQSLGGVRRLTGEYPGATEVLELALGLYREIGSRVGEASVLTELGITRCVTGEYPGAAQALEQALDIYRDIGDKQGEAEALNEQGALHRVRGDLGCAEGCHQQALDLARALGSSHEEACALAGLGRCAIAAGRTAQAAVLLSQAHEIFERIGAAETRDILAELDALTRPGPPESGQP